MNIFFQQLLNGLTLGSVYALVALGLTLVYGILHIPNFAHGALYMVGAYVAFYFVGSLGANYWVAMIGAAAAVAVLAVLSDRLVFHRLRNSPPLHDMIAAIGLLLFLEAVVQALWGAEFHRLAAPYPQIIRMFDLVAPAQRLLIIGAAFGLMAVLHLFLTRTMTGSTIIAMAQDREGASLVGIDATKVSVLTFAISGALAAIAATLFAPINLIYPAMGNLVIMKAFVIIILGGMGSIPGAIVGGLVIGFAESFGAFYVSTDYKDIIAFGLLVLILSLRPEGLFPSGSPLMSATSLRMIVLCVLLALALAFPAIAPNEYYIYVMALAYIMAIAAIGLNLILGYTGQLNLAHAGFMAIGAYTVGILTVDYGVPYWIAFVAAGLVASLVGLVAGIVSLRLKTHFFAIFTLCVGFIIYLVLEKSDALTHGTVGLMGIPAPTGIGPIRFDTTWSQYYLVLFFLVISLWLMSRIVNSLLGRAFVAIRNSEDLAEALGISLMRTKVLAFVLSTFYAGVAGALYAGFVRFLGPGLALETHTFDMIAFILVGGIGTLYGPLLGAIILTWLTQSLQFLQDFRMIVFGPLLVLLVMFMPQGLIGLYRQRKARGAATAQKERSDPQAVLRPSGKEARANA